MRRLLAFILRPVFYFGLRFMDWEPWERLSHGIAPPQFGAGSHHDFRWYFEGQSTVSVKDMAAICEWLADCEYVRDPVHERDFWQHPKTFEQLRKGDCEDHALWAWRKLTELGISADARGSSKRLSSALCDRRAIQFRRVWRLYAIPETGTR